MKSKNIIFITIISIMMLAALNVNAQGGNGGNIPIGNANDILGWDNTGGTTTDLTIENKFSNKHINFLTTTSGTKRMSILSTGEVGIGNFSGFTPAYLLDVNGGDININTSTKGYRIYNSTTPAGGKYVLLNNGHQEDIFVGIYAGNGTMNGHFNTYVGNNAGGLTSAGYENTFVGYNAGAETNSGHNNTFVGKQSGWWNTNGNDNAFYGFESGANNQIGINNTFIGSGAGRQNEYLLSGTAASNNTAVGFDAGIANISGNKNLFLGANANPYHTYLENATAIGCSTTVRTSNTIILGNDTINVGIGLSDDPTGTGPAARLHVIQDAGAANASEITALIENKDHKYEAYSTNGYGLVSTSMGDNYTNYGGAFEAANGLYNIAGAFYAAAVYDDVINIGNVGGEFYTANGSTNIGVNSIAESGDNTAYNYGVSGIAHVGERTEFNVGVYGFGEIPVDPDVQSIYAGSWAGYFDGDVNISGTTYHFSDSRIKTDVQHLEDASFILSHINGYSFYFDTTQLDNIANVPHRLQYGVLAQEVEAVAPNLVLNTIMAPRLDSVFGLISPIKEVKTVNYIGLIPLLIEGFNKQQARIDSLVEALAELNNTGQRSTVNNPSQSTQHLTTELSDVNAIVLDQNSPNPFAEQTKVTWNIPAENSEVVNGMDAKIFFYNQFGTILKTVKIEQAGYGELIVYANNLSSGTYTYSLVVNGKVIDSKTMVKGK